MTVHEDEPADLSLEQVEDHAWGDAPSDTTRLMATVHRLRRNPIKDLTAADLRTLIAQRVGLAGNGQLPRKAIDTGPNSIRGRSVLP